MKLYDVAGRTKEFEGIQRKVRSFVKTLTCNVGDTTFSENGGVYHIEVVNDGKIARDIEEIVRKSPHGEPILVKDYEGTYDWKADVYNRPSSIVSFKL